MPRLLEELARKEMRPFRSGIVTALGNMGPAAKNAVPDLIQHLDHPDTRFAAIEALGKLGPEAAGAIGALDDLLTYRGRDTRWVAALALHRIDPATKRLLPLLIECLSSDDYSVSSSAESILESNRAISEPALLSALTDERLAVRLGAARVLDDLDHDASQLVPILVEGLESEDAGIRSMAAADTSSFAIGHSSEELARPLVDPLLQVRQDDDGEVREYAVQALGDLELDPERVVPALVQTLESDKDEDVRQAAADALREFGAAAARAVPALCRALGDDGAWVRTAAIGALGDIVPMTPETLVPVAERLADTDTRVREESSEVLRDFFQEQDQAPLRHAKPVLSVIVRVMENGYAAVRDECTQVLIVIGVDAIPTMRALLRHEDEDLRSRAQIWLDEIGAD